MQTNKRPEMIDACPKNEAVHDRKARTLRRLPVLSVILLVVAIFPQGRTRAAAASISGLQVQGNQIVNGSGQVQRLVGVDRSGSEYACIQGWGFFDGPSDAASVQAMASWHINAVRVPLNEDCWLNINGSPSAYSGAAYQQAIINYVNLLNTYNIVPILDLHWNAAGSTKATGQQPMADRDHAPAFWSSVASTFKSNTSVIFDLYNEPYPDSNQNTTAAWTCWKNGGTCPGVSFVAAGMQELVNAVRNSGATNLILANGVMYGGNLSQWLTYRPTDPKNNVAAGFHNYNFSGCGSTCWQSTYGPVMQQVPVIAGEIGENDCAHSYIDSLMAWMDSHGGSYLGWAWNTSSCTSFPSLISNYNGTATGFGVGFEQHLASLAGANPTSTPVSTATSTTQPSPTPTSTPKPAPTTTATPRPTSTSTATPVPANTATPTPSSTSTPVTTNTPGPGSTTLFADTFEGDTLGGAVTGWRQDGGTWGIVQDGSHVASQTDSTAGTIKDLVAGSAAWTNYTVTANMKPGNLTNGLGITGRYQDSANNYDLILKGGNTWYVGKRVGGTWYSMASGSLAYNTSTWYTLQLTFAGTSITGSVNGITLATSTDTSFSHGPISIRPWGPAEYDNVTVK
jgi:cell division septation protein DedD